MHYRRSHIEDRLPTFGPLAFPRQPSTRADVRDLPPVPSLPPWSARTAPRKMLMNKGGFTSSRRKNESARALKFHPCDANDTQLAIPALSLSLRSKHNTNIVSCAIVSKRNLHDAPEGCAIELDRRDSPHNPVRFLHDDFVARRMIVECNFKVSPRPRNAGVEMENRAAQPESEDPLDAGAIHPTR